MANCTFGQAVREAIESERAAARYLIALAAREISPVGRLLCYNFAEHEQRTAAKLEALACRLETGDLAHYAEIQIDPAPVIPSSAPEAGSSAAHSLSIARSTAYRLALYYDALVDASPTHVPLFRELARSEEQLADRLHRLTRLSAAGRDGPAIASAG